MKAIWKRELKSYFQNITGWLYIAATLALYGLYFFAYNLSFGYAKVSYPLNAITFLVLITVPVLTMRSLAEEKKSKTDQLILTAPVSVGKIVMAKYLAMAAVHTAAMLIIAATPFLLSAFGTVAMGESYAAVLGFWLYGLLCIAIGLFVSSLTESQVISAVLTFVFLFMGFMMKSVTGIFSSAGNVLTKILNCYDLVTPLDSFMNGRLSVTGIVYYVTLIALFLFLTAQSIQKRRFTVSTKKLKLGAFSIGFVVIAAALAVFVNLFAAELPGAYMEIDLTASKLYSLTEDTRAFLKDLDKDVEVYVIESEEDADATVAETLKRYEDATGHIKVEYKDPAVNPSFYQQYTDENISRGSLIFACGNVSKVVDYYDLYETEIDYTTYSQQTTGYDGEGQITSALQYVTNENMPVIYQITGHGETELSGSFSEAAEKANVTLQTINLLETDAVPEDAQAVIINGPSSDFSGDDADKIIAYLNAGGNVLATANAQAEGELSNYNRILGEYGVSLVKGIVAEGDSGHFYQNPFYLLPEVETTDYTASAGSNYIFAPYARAVSYPESGDEILYTALLSTSDAAVAKADTANAETYEYEDGDEKGPFAIAVAAVKQEQEEGDEGAAGRLLVYGSMEIFSENADQMVSGSNSGIFADALKQMVNTDDMAAVVIPVKSYDNSRLMVSAFAGRLTGLCMIIFVPAVLLAAGVVVWIRRRRR